MKHKIKYEYRTGDSFRNEDAEDILEYEWDDLDVAKEALKRIREHYVWYRYKENSRSRWRDDEPEVKQPKWWNVKSEYGNDHCIINIPLDNGKDVQFWCPWCGYFETLYGAEIVSEDNDMKFETGYR